MPRPKSCRRVLSEPVHSVFKPAGIPASTLDFIILAVEELEAIRLSDLEGAYHEQAASKMNISRQTFGRILESARHKVAKALINGMALRIEGGAFEIPQQRSFTCQACGNEWQEPFGTGRPAGCPACGSSEFFRSECRNQGGRE